jgi:hypothetical protein
MGRNELTAKEGWMKMLGRILLLAGLLSATLVSADELLPGPVAFHLKEAERLLERAEVSAHKATLGKTKQAEMLKAARIDLDAARAKMGEIEQRHAGEFSPFHPDITEVRRRILDLDLDLSAKPLPEGPAVEAPPSETPAPASFPPGSTAYWRARLRPFLLHPSHAEFDSASYLDPRATSDAAQMQQRLDVYSRAAATLTEFRQSQVGVAPPVELQQMALDIENALRRFGLSCLQHADQELTDADGDVQRLEQFVREQDDNLARGKPISLMEREDLQRLDAAIARAARLVRSDDACLLDVRLRLSALKRHDVRLRQLGAADTRMRPPAYAGSDALALQQAAGRAVQVHRPGVRILKTVLVSPAWSEETVVEWADFQQEQLQQRVARRLTAQVAARHGEDVLLFTIELRQVRLPSGLWGPVSGTVQFVDPILEKNIS